MSGWSWAPWGGGPPVPIIIGPMESAPEPTFGSAAWFERENARIGRRIVENNARIAEFTEKHSGGPRFVDGGGI